MGDISNTLRKDLSKISDKRKSAAMRIPFLTGFIDDIVQIFELIVVALGKIEDKIDENK